MNLENSWSIGSTRAIKKYVRLSFLPTYDLSHFEFDFHFDFDVDDHHKLDDFWFEICFDTWSSLEQN